MTTSPTIEVATDPPRVVIDGLTIVSAPTVEKLHVVLGRPGRIESGETPAPVGHRNNQIHIYDQLGLVFHEHHYTRRAESIWCWFEVEDRRYRFTPHESFRGHLLFDGVEMPFGGLETSFLDFSPFHFVRELGDVWNFAFDGFGIFVHSRGPFLPSGRRSKVRRITDVSISWPHDNRAVAET